MPTITHEALAEGAPTIIGVAVTDLSKQPVTRRVKNSEQVVQNDRSLECLGGAGFHEMLQLYGDLRAQIVTPIVVNGSTRGEARTCPVACPRYIYV